MDPVTPTCVWMFAGYEQEMADFIRSNPGFSRRTPFRFHFPDYSVRSLARILKLMLEAEGESCERDVMDFMPSLLQSTFSTSFRRSVCVVCV